MSADIVLRPATLQDAALLLDWRNDPLTRLSSHSADEIPLDEHLAWLNRILGDPLRQLLIA
ncbi:MAG: GCN5-like N-acetyltransferase, partial [Rhodocyclales bacterium]|nr:GCN5-like N-acetyltransferase [Rhodocyclales bacterium]